MIAARSQDRAKRERRSVHGLEALESRCVLAAPTLGALSPVTLLTGAPLNIALNGNDADGDPLTFSVTSDNPFITPAIVLSDHSLKITTVQKDSNGTVVQNFGDMVFELFDQDAPRTTARIEQLVNQGFYNNLTFHRIIQDFVVQGGDPLGTGFGGSGVTMDDEFNPNLRFTSPGILAMAKSNDDTNDSQFFVTTVTRRVLDFSYSIFGFLTKGEDVRQAIAAVPTDGNDKPLAPVVMQSVSLFHDTQDAVLRLSAPIGTTGPANITVTVSDGHGGTATQTFHVDVSFDTITDPPFLLPLADVHTTQGQEVDYELDAQDVQDNQVEFGVTIIPAGLSVLAPTGSTDVTPVNQIAKLPIQLVPDPGLVGKQSLRFYARSSIVTQTDDQHVDAQAVTLFISPSAPGSITLDPASDTGSNTSDNYTSLNNSPGKPLTFHAAGVLQGATVTLKAGNQVIGTATAPAGATGQNPTTLTLDITTNVSATLADGAQAITAIQTFDSLDSIASAPFNITVDTRRPVFTSTAPASAIGGIQVPYVYDVRTDEDTTPGVKYNLVNGPTGMSIDAATGHLTWLPSTSQVGANSVAVRAIDLAGNSSDQAFSISVLPDSPPALNPFTAQTVAGLHALSVTAVATDSDTAQGDVLRFSLGSGAPTGATIGAASGLFTWTPTAAQSPGQYSIPVVVTDAAGATAQQTLAVTVSAVPLAPTLAALSDVTLLAGAPLNVALNGNIANGDPLTFSVTSDNPAITAILPQNNNSLKITTVQKDANGNIVQNFGDMILQLFDGEAPNTTARIEQLVNQGFYNGIIFHRIIQNFVIQGGDPTGTGSGGSGVQFDDEFNPDLRFTSSGILAMAKSNDDTNDSQFFVTAAPERPLDFQHSIFGFLTKGEDVRQAIASVQTNSSNDKPLEDVVMQSVSIFHDTQDAVLRLSAAPGTTGSANITVTVSDGHGGTTTRTFHVTVNADTTTDPPFLLPLTNPHTTQGTSVSYELVAQDVRNNQVEFQASDFPSGITFDVPSGSIDVTPVDHIARLPITIIPDPSLVGKQTIRFFVQTPGNSQHDDLHVDAQVVTLLITPNAPTGITLDPTSDTGSSNSDNYTSLNNTAGKPLTLRVSGVYQGATVTLKIGDTVIGQATATAAPSGQNPSQVTLHVTTNATVPLTDGTHAVTAIQTLDGLDSAVSAPINITVDTRPPAFVSTAPTSAFGGIRVPYIYNVHTDEDHSPGVAFSLVTGPSGMSINPATGQITWLPSTGQVGANSATVQVFDRAGNASNQTFSVSVLPDSPPVLNPFASQTVDEQSPLSASAAATDPNIVNGDRLRFSLAPGAPAGAAIDANSGLFTWAPTEAQGPRHYAIGVVVSDTAEMSAEQILDVTVNEVNQPPVLAPISSQFAAPGQLLRLAVPVQDPDSPANQLHFQLLGSVPDGAAIDPVIGVFTWTPTTTQLSAPVNITVEVVDNGLPSLVATEIFTISVFASGVGIFPGGGPGLPFFVTPNAATVLVASNTNIVNTAPSATNLAAAAVAANLSTQGAATSSAANLAARIYTGVESPGSLSLGPMIRTVSQFQIGPDTGVGEDLIAPIPRALPNAPEAKDLLIAPMPRELRQKPVGPPPSNDTPPVNGDVPQGQSSSPDDDTQGSGQTPQGQPSAGRTDADAQREARNQVIDFLEFGRADLVLDELLGLVPTEAGQRLYSNGAEPALDKHFDVQWETASPAADFGPRGTSAPQRRQRAELSGSAEPPMTGHVISRFATGVALAAGGMYVPLLVTELRTDEEPASRPWHRRRRSR